METYEEKYKDLVKRLNKAREEKGVYTFNSVLDAVAPELKIEESEDEKIRKALLEMVHDTTGDELWIGYDVHKEDALTWLEKQGELKPAWSEEDEMIALSIEQVMNCASLLNIVPEKIDKIRTWLKSLKDRYTWKPSDEQMVALKCAITTADEKWVCMNTKDLESLYEDLKKLKE